MNAPLIIPIYGKTPNIHESAFIAPGCKIIGDVEIGPDVSIWYNCVIRAEVNHVRIGARTNIQDGTVIHCDPPEPEKPEGYPTIIGEDVLVGHMAMVHGCVLEDRAFVGLSTTVMNGAVIEGEGMLAAGAMLTPGKRIKRNELWSGVPARFTRALNEHALAAMRQSVVHYVENGRAHKVALDAAKV